MVSEPSTSWLLLIHQIPPHPAYLRVKIGRRLAKVGAIALKNSVYVLPENEATLEDLHWIAREVAEDGGESTLSRTQFIEGLTDEELRGQFRRARQAEYTEIAEAARHAAADPEAQGGNEEGRRAATLRELNRLQRRIEGVIALDFFAAEGRAEAEAALLALRGRMSGTEAPGREPEGAPAQFQGRTWVTRQGVKVDRIASAWLIQRYIDPQARFKFVSPQGYVPAEDEVRFDMFEAEFTHEGEACTFEVLLQRLAAPDEALTAIAEIIHDIDLKDGKYGRAEAAGVARLIDGICAGTPDDLERIERGGALLKDLFACFSRAESQEA